MSSPLLLLAWLTSPHADPQAIENGRQLHEQTVALLTAGNYQEGVATGERALQIRQAAMGEEHPDTTATMAILAKLYLFVGEYAKAEVLGKRTLAVREKTLGSEHPDTADSVNLLGNLYLLTEDHAQAELQYQRALAIRMKVLGLEHLETAKSLHSLALLYETKGLPSKAKPMAQRALEITQKLLGAEHPETAKRMNNLARILHAQGAYEQAEPLFERALAVQEKVLGPEHPDTAQSLGNLGKFYTTVGVHSKAISLLSRARVLREKASGSDSPLTAWSLNALGNAYKAAGNTEAAEPLLLRALAIEEKTLGGENPGLLASLNSLADLYRITGEYTKAESLRLRVLSLSEKTYGPENLNTAESSIALAQVYRDMGAYSKAEALQLRALAILEKMGVSRHPYTATAFAELGMIRWAAGDAAKAVQFIARSYEIDAQVDDRFLVARSEVRNRLYLDNRLPAAFRSISLSVSFPTPESVALGLSSVLRHKARALDEQANSVARLRQSVRAQDLTLFEQLTEIAQQLSALIYRGPESRSPQAYRQQIDALTARQEALEAQLARNSNEFRQQQRPATLAAVRDAIPEGAVLLEWMKYQPFDPKAPLKEQGRSPSRYVVYALKRSGGPTVLDLGAADEIDRLVHEFRLAVSDPARTDVRASAATLSRKIIEPLRASLHGARQLLVAPDGALSVVPMAALLDEGARYLAERYEISYLTSGRDLLRIAEDRTRRGREVVVFADPDYGKQAPSQVLAQTASTQRSAEVDRGGLMFRPLPGTALEAEAIQRLLPTKVRVLTRERATEVSLKALRSPQILHLATHGFFLSDQTPRSLRPANTSAVQIAVEDPLLRSGLALAGANRRSSGPSDDGILTALEASRLDLLGTQLVVLSACDTGLGEITNAEGVSGLRRGLFLAGAQTQVSSLWKVADVPTQQLMQNMYGYLMKGTGRSAALRLAQQSMLVSSKTSHPYYWAGFVSIGDWTPLSIMPASKSMSR